MADDGVGDSMLILSVLSKTKYIGMSAQAGHSYQLSMYDTLHLSILIDIYVYNGELAKRGW
jgi:hypothetical protein